MLPEDNRPDEPGVGSLARREFLVGSAAAVAAGWWVRPLAAEEPAPQARYRVAVIGHTGRGNYGHGLDAVWSEIPATQVVAVADADPAGLTAAVNRLGGVKGFADYRRMLDEVKPDLVAVAPRWLDQHCAMVMAAAERGAKGIYLEKPLARTLAEADAMRAACQKHGTKLAIAFQTRYSPKLAVVDELISSGRLGRILELRARGKEDARGGGEDLWVLGSHMMNLMHHWGGPPEWCFGTVLREGRPVTRADVAEGNEGIGPLAGDEVHAMYRLEKGITAHFDSIRGGQGSPSRFGLEIYGSEGIVGLYNTGELPQALYLADSSWSPGRSGKAWQPISSAGVGQPETQPDQGLHGGNVRAVRDLIAAIEEDRPPLASLDDACTATEMVVAVLESHRQGRPVPFPLENRENPLTAMEHGIPRAG